MQKNKKRKENDNIGMVEKNVYIALKMIEGIYKQGLISKIVYRNILNDYQDKIDIEEFLWYIDDNKTTNNKKRMEVA